MTRPWFFPRQGEVWIGGWGFFWSPDIKGVELPSGRFISI